jgi:beta-glucanase (GH16 family)
VRGRRRDRLAGQDDAGAITFQDEFDGPAGAPPDPARWRYDLGGGGWGNGESQVYTDSPANVFQDGQSHLIIRARREAGDDQPGGPACTSGRITTQHRFAQLGGTFEARIKVSSRRGLWPAFWLMGADFSTSGWPACGEVDVLEDFGYRTGQSSVHAPADDGNALHSRHADFPLDDGWHVYRLSWQPGGMRFSGDGHPYLEVSRDFCPPRAWVFGPGVPHNGGMFLLLNLAVGGNAGPPADAAFPADLMVDYVRVTAPGLR